MASDILDQVLCGKIPWNDLVTWLSGEADSIQTALDGATCNHGDFVVYFINLLHDDAASTLQKSYTGNTPKKPTSSGKDFKENSTNRRRRIELFPPGTKNENSCIISSKSEKIYRNNSNKSGVNRDYTLRSVLNSSIGSGNKSPIDSNSRDRNLLSFESTKNKSANSRKSNLTNSKDGIENKSYSFASVEPSIEEIFLQSCPLSPITTDLNTCSVNKTGNNELDSPNNRVVLKDGRKSGSNKKRTSIGRSTSSPCNSSFNISDHSFPVLGSNSKTSSSYRRRIKPTRLTESYDKGSRHSDSTGYTFGDLIRPSEPTTPFREESFDGTCNGNAVSDIREMLRLEKVKLDHSPLTITSSPKSSHLLSHIIPKHDCVKEADKLLILVNIYNILLNTNLICNIVRELHFIFSLLMAQVSECVSSEVKYFKSVHECVYFATSVLNMQRELLKCLDKSSLKSLAYNTRIQSFLPELQKYIVGIYEERSTEKDDIYYSSTVFPGTVCFQCDTDNRENFPTENAFVTFRKQRDAFYDILRKWEENHRSQGWSFGIALGSQIHHLLNLNDEPANFVHFARLFRSQLLGSCEKSSKCKETELDESALEVLKCLKEGNPDKYSRLYERLVAPLKSSNPSALPEFPGQQEFYRDFIRHAGHATFNNHLIDSFWHEILNLNSSIFSASEVEEECSRVDDDTRLSFVSCVRNLQLLAKFLGFVVYLPYETRSKISEPMAIAHSSLRSQLQPRVDIMACIQEAIERERITLVIPWIVQYLAMIDCVSVYLSYYKSIMKQLFALYYSLPSYKGVSRCGRVLLGISLGWLFEMPQFPEDMFYTWCINESKNCMDTSISRDSSHECSNIDNLDLVNYQCLYSLCPPLETVKWFLLSDSSTTNVGSARHITPVPVDNDQPMLTSAARQIEVQLEQNFLDSHPSSMRRTIEYVSERISSSCVKYICGKPLQEIKERILRQLKEAYNHANKEHTHSKTSEAMRCSQELKTQCCELAPKFCEAKCSAVMPLLLPEEISKPIINMCVQIAVRNSVEKVNLWINSHITQGTFVKDITSEVHKRTSSSDIPKSSNTLSHGWRMVPEKDGTLAPAHAIQITQRLIWKVMGNCEEVNCDEIVTTLHNILDTLLYRRDLIPTAERILGLLSIDLCLAVVTYRPKIVTEKFLNNFLNVWKTSEVETSKCFDRFMCSRNVMLLSHSSQASRTWSTIAHLLLFLIKNDVLSASDLETQCVGLLQQDWPLDILKQMSSCFEEFTKLYQSQSNYDDFALLMELLSELCLGIDDLADDTF